MWLEKDGIRVEHNHPADIARLKVLGYVVVELSVKVEPAPMVEQTPEEQNAEAIEAVNTSKGTPRTTKGGDK